MSQSICWLTFFYSAIFVLSIRRMKVSSPILLHFFLSTQLFSFSPYDVWTWVSQFCFIFFFLLSNFLHHHTTYEHELTNFASFFFFSTQQLPSSPYYVWTWVNQFCFIFFRLSYFSFSYFILILYMKMKSIYLLTRFYLHNYLLFYSFILLMLVSWNWNRMYILNWKEEFYFFFVFFRHSNSNSRKKSNVDPYIHLYVKMMK